MNFVNELKWRGMIHDIMPGTEKQLESEKTTAYIGFDPSSDSLHIGNLVGIMILQQFQRAGHKPLVLIGGATGMIGDPSGKSQERNLLDEKELRFNQSAIRKQLEKFLDFDPKEPNAAEVVNNWDWMKTFSFLDFIRDIGKHLTVNYLIAKESVKKRLDPETGSGMSFTEFSYQLVQGYDFLHLYKEKNCKLQMGGSDQWGNIVTGTELIRRKEQGEAFALTSPLITRSDGGKFGKTEEGNVWLDPKRTSPYKFYQFWLNVSDEDAEKYIKIFTFLSKDKINTLIDEHKKAPHQRLLQKTLSKEVTIMVHSEKDYETAIEATGILFGKATTEQLQKLDEETFLSVFEGVPTFDVSSKEIISGIGLMELLTEKTQVFQSKGEMKRFMKGGGLSLNKTKMEDPEVNISQSNLINNKYLLVQKGKKNYFLLKVIC